MVSKLRTSWIEVPLKWSNVSRNSDIGHSPILFHPYIIWLGNKIVTWDYTRIIPFNTFISPGLLLLLAPGCLLVSLLVVPLVVASLVVTSLVVATSLSPTRVVSLVSPTLLGLGLPLGFYITVASSLKWVEREELTKMATIVLWDGTYNNYYVIFTFRCWWFWRSPLK